jgi:hypothetical protein
VPGKAHPTGKGGRRADLGNVYFRSRWEANWARYLNRRVAEGEIARWEFEPDTFEFPEGAGANAYTPDFKVWGVDGAFVYQEVKGWLNEHGALRLRLMGEHYPGVHVELVARQEYRAVAKRVARQIPGWEVSQKKGWIG